MVDSDGHATPYIGREAGHRGRFTFCVESIGAGEVGAKLKAN